MAMATVSTFVLNQHTVPHEGRAAPVTVTVYLNQGCVRRDAVPPVQSVTRVCAKTRAFALSATSPNLISARGLPSGCSYYRVTGLFRGSIPASSGHQMDQL